MRVHIPASIRSPQLSSRKLGIAISAALLASLAVSPAHAASCPTVNADGTTTPAAGAGVDWSGCDLRGADLSGVDLSNANLSSVRAFGVNFSGSDLQATNFSDAGLRRANLNNARMSYSSWDESTLLTRANLTNATFIATDIYNTTFGSAIVEGTNFTDANMGSDLGGYYGEGVASGCNLVGTPAALPRHWRIVSGTATTNCLDYEYSAPNDTTAPEVTFYMADPPGTNGWYLGDVFGAVGAVDPPDGTDEPDAIIDSLTCSATVAGSPAIPVPAENTVGPGSAPGYSPDVYLDSMGFSAEGIAVLTCTAVDQNGNTGSASITVKSDSVAPTVTCSAPPRFILNQPGRSVTANVADTNSGPAASTVSAPARTWTVGAGLAANVTGRDRAGNATSVNCRYSVVNGLLGFRTPLPNGSVSATNTTFPVAFKLGDYSGVGLTDSIAANVPTRVTLSTDATGTNPITSASCWYAWATDEFRCTLARPSVVQPYPTKYYVTAYQSLGGAWVRLPSVPTASTPNPVAIYFR